MSRSKLPFRETSDSFLIYEGKILAFDKGTYIQYPGGGVDPGETPEQAVRREIKEEVGCVVEKLKLINSTDALWWPGWTEGKEKREKRYKEFQGERTHLFVGFINKFGKPTSKEGDAWPGNIKKYLIDPKVLAKKIRKKGINHPNFECYTLNQITIIEMIDYIKKSLK